MQKHLKNSYDWATKSNFTIFFTKRLDIDDDDELVAVWRLVSGSKSGQQERGDGFQGICCFAQVNRYLIVAQAQTSGTAAGGSWYREVEAEVEAQVSGDEGRSKAGVNEAVAVELELRGDTGSENNEEFRNETSGSNKLTRRVWH